MNEISPSAEKSKPTGNRGYLALLSLLIGLAFCVPPAAFIAFFLGIAALRSNKPQIGGRAAAGTGLLLSLGGFALIGWVVYSTWILGAPAARFTEGFIQDLSAGRMDAAISKSDGEVTPSEVAQWAQQVRGLAGPLKVECTLPVYQSSGKGTTRRFAYTIDATVLATDGKTRTFTLGLLRSGGVFLVWNFQ